MRSLARPQTSSLFTRKKFEDKMMMKPRMMGCPILRRVFVTLIPKQLYQRVPVVAPLRVVAPS